MLSIWMLSCPSSLCSSVRLFNRDSIPGPVPVKYDLHFSLYRPQRSCGKAMFLHLCVILFTRGISVPTCTRGHMTRGPLSRGSLSGGSLSGGSLSGRPPYSNAWMVRILLECILVINVFILFGRVKCSFETLIFVNSLNI